MEESQSIKKADQIEKNGRNGEYEDYEFDTGKEVGTQLSPEVGEQAIHLFRIQAKSAVNNKLGHCIKSFILENLFSPK